LVQTRDQPAELAQHSDSGAKIGLQVTD
jgi:hypothetical protein